MQPSRCPLSRAHHATTSCPASARLSPRQKGACAGAGNARAAGARGHCIGARRAAAIRVPVPLLCPHAGRGVPRAPSCTRAAVSTSGLSRSRQQAFRGACEPLMRRHGSEATGAAGGFCALAPRRLGDDSGGERSGRRVAGHLACMRGSRHAAARAAPCALAATAAAGRAASPHAASGLSPGRVYDGAAGARAGGGARCDARADAAAD